MRMLSHRSQRAVALAGAVVLCVLFIAMAPAPVHAQGVAPVAIEQPRDDDKGVMLSAAYDHQFETDVDKDGDFSRDSVALAAQVKFDITDKFSLTPLFRWENHTYDFSNDAKNIGFRWNNVNFGLVGLMLNYKINSNWSLLGAPIVRYQGEAGADVDDSVDGGGLVGFIYHPSPRLQIGLLIGAVSALEEDLAILPIPMVRWQAGDEITLKLGIQPLGSRVGLGPEFLWHPTDDFKLGFGGVFMNRRFRLDDHGRKARATSQANGSRPRVISGRSVDGIGQERSFPVYLRAEWSPVEGLGLEAFGAIVLGGELVVEEEFGDQIQQEEYDATGLAGLRAVYRF